MLATRAVLLTFGLLSAAGSTTVPVIQGQVNRVPEPRDSDFTVMWPILRGRLGTNIDTYTDVKVTGQIAGTNMTVATVVSGGPITLNIPVYGTGVADGTFIRSQTSGSPGGAGVYVLTKSATVAPGSTLYLGTLGAQQYTEVVLQIDVHGPASADNAQRICTLMRDEYAVQRYQDTGFQITPLYADDPRQVPFINGEQQYEERWVVDVHLQVNPVITVTQQFADELQIAIQPVETAP